jgi:PTH2 family peptidyl-tRNA hydrolase
MNKEPKQVIVMRTDLGMRKGKMIAQGAHASLGVILGLMKRSQDEEVLFGSREGIKLKPTGKARLILPYETNSHLGRWLEGRFTKICLRCESEEELLELLNAAEAAELPCKLIIDAGLTEFDGIPTKTCIAIGPANPDKIDKITGHLKLL